MYYIVMINPDRNIVISILKNVNVAFIFKWK